MGLTGVLARSVFSKSRLFTSQDINVRNDVVDKKRWSSVRSYLCGDEFNSVLAEEDSASFRNSETTVSQFISDDDHSTYKQQSETESEVTMEDDQSLRTCFSYEHDHQAAIVIQSAFRGFLVRRRREVIESTSKKTDNGVEMKSPGRESSAGTSLEVQTGNSINVFTTPQENAAFQQRMQLKARNHALKLKEEWDDSTVSSNISKMRVQNRLEATTRRERALAYAFSQQLRICPKKKLMKWEDCTEQQPSMGWSWLERWMAARGPENNTAFADRINQRWAIGNKPLNISMEGKESCGSNEVPIQVENIQVPVCKPVKNRLKATRPVRRHKTGPDYHSIDDHKKGNKKDSTEDEKKSNNSALDS